MPEDDLAPKTLPYSSFGTWQTTLDHYGVVGIPNLIDRNTLPPTLSGSSRYEILGTMRFFACVDEAGKPNTALLAKLIDKESRREAMLQLLRFHYSGLFALPLATAGPTEVKKWFSDNATPSTADRARAFFLSAAKQMGIPLHTLVAKGTRSVTGSIKRKRRKLAQKPAESGDLPGATSGETDIPSGGTTKTVSLRLGAGQLTVKVNVDLWDLQGDDRTFVFAIMDALRAYERGDIVAPFAVNAGAAES